MGVILWMSYNKEKQCEPQLSPRMEKKKEKDMYCKNALHQLILPFHFIQKHTTNAAFCCLLAPHTFLYSQENDEIEG